MSKSVLPADLSGFQDRALLLKADRAHEGGDFASAVRLCQEALRRDPNQPRALQILGSMAQQTGSNEVALGFFRRAIAADGTLVAAHIGAGDAYMALCQWDSAIAAYGRAASLEPHDENGLTSLGAAYMAAGDNDRALDSFRRAAAINPLSKLARYMLAGLAEGRAGPQSAYVRSVFDGYAGMFEEHLVGTLHYRVPELIANALAAEHPVPFAAALDLGCGTGLVADQLAPGRIAVIDGVDLSPRMIEVARRKNRYRALHVGDLMDFLKRSEAATAGYDLVVAADVFIYVGRLEEVFAAVRAILRPGGLFVFSVEHSDGEGCALRPSSRYAHNEPYIAGLADANGFKRHPAGIVPLRHENKTDILGRLEILQG